jgi:hypothetical protein
MSITGALFQGGVIKTGYYYFYDMKVKSLDCPTPTRKAVVASLTDIGTPVISPNATVRLCQGQTISLSSSQSTGWTYQWQVDGRDIANATNATYLARAGGRYTVRITQDGLCTNASTPVQVSLSSVLTPLVNVSGTVLTSTPASAYQWLLDNKPIAGATAQSLTATQSGAYQVQVTENGCSAVSDPASVSVVTSIQEEPFMGIGLNLSPNPTSDILTIQFRTERVVQGVQAQLYSVSGVPLKLTTLERKSNGLYTSTLDVSQLARGAFFVKITAGDEQVSKSFVKE